MTRPFNDPENMTNVLDLITYTNNATNVGSGQMLGTLMMAGLGMIALMISKAFTSFDRAAAFAAFFTMMLSLLFFVLKLINGTVLTVTLILMSLSIYFLTKSQSTEI